MYFSVLISRVCSSESFVPQNDFLQNPMLSIPPPSWYEKVYRRVSTPLLLYHSGGCVATYLGIIYLGIFESACMVMLFTRILFAVIYLLNHGNFWEE